LLKIKSDETTEDKKFTLESCRCIGACGLAPVLKVNEEVYGRLNKKKSEKVLMTYQKEA
jgi:NADP-reducing hydrogenase subunit HndA